MSGILDPVAPACVAVVPGMWMSAPGATSLFSSRKLVKLDWMAEQDWVGLVLALIGDAEEAAQLKLLQDLAGNADSRNQ